MGFKMIAVRKDMGFSKGNEKMWASKVIGIGGFFFLSYSGWDVYNFQTGGSTGSSHRSSTSGLLGVYKGSSTGQRILRVYVVDSLAFAG